MQADIAGLQRKVVRSSVRPAKSVYGTSGIGLVDGKTLPFSVSRGWNAPAGNYLEAFYIVAPDTKEVHYESPTQTRLIWGLASVTDVVTEVSIPLALAPGTYTIVFALGSIKGGETEVQVFEVDTKAA